MNNNNLYLEEEIDNSEDALRLIRAIGLDYDGYRKADSLMDLIDELCKIANTGLEKSKENKIDIFDVADVFLSFESMQHKKLQKLCYYVQAWHLALFDKPLFDERFEAWIHGAVSPKLYDKYKDYGWQEINKNIDEINTNIKFESIDLIKEVYDIYGEYSGDQLESLIQQEKPWQKARGDLKPLETCTNEIKHEDMKKYYLNIYEESERSK